MIEDAWWITSPIGHRQESNRQGKEWAAEEEEGVAKFFSGALLADDEWVCDFCNGDILIYNPAGQEQFVPMLSSYALCNQCVEKEVRKDPDALEVYRAHGDPARWWSRMFCACPPCKKRAEDLSREYLASRQGPN